MPEEHETENGWMRDDVLTRVKQKGLFTYKEMSRGSYKMGYHGCNAPVIEMPHKKTTPYFECFSSM